ncbi:MAG TPA: 4Fe-4S dicluster domain-containing protein, partial [Kofleriaceae bacterium]|nr:4Fe-4S dicluster domain-containing protein [Kofleriaceae bacterium]
STQHVFKDLYRMQMARSLLVIDQDTCVRCGHCAWSCEQTHGTSRLIRRGDKVITQLADGAATLLLPNTCQHCRQAACMIDCPTGAIGRDPEGEVFIRPSLCTGCGNCAKACPWENIQLAPRPSTTPPTKLTLSADIAVKCDLCRGFAAPACVEACPTGSVMRLDPQRDVAEVARILGLPTPTSRVSAKPSRGAASTAPSPAAARSTASIGASSSAVSAETSRETAANALRSHRAAIGPTASIDGSAAAASRSAASNAAVSAETSRPQRAVSATSISRIALRSAGLAAAIAVTASGWVIRHKLGWTASHGGGLVAGMLAGLLIIALGAYIVPKRLRAKARPRKRTDEPRPAVRSRLRPHFLVHLGLGVILPAAALAHAGVRFHDGTGGALAAALGVTVLVGVVAAIMYFAVPPVLTRLERRGVLPEDLAGERETLEARLYQAVTGSSDRVKALVDRILMPYARARFGPATLVRSGLRLSEERQRLRQSIDVALAGRTPDGADTLIEIAVELRALPARRLLGRLLRMWPPIHAVTGAITIALLVAHIVAAVMR